MRGLLLFSMLAAGGLTQTIQVHGHRGARAMRPENTLPAFEYAIAQGVDALELDMAVTRDNVIVVSHDPVLEAPVCSGPAAKAVIRELTLEQVLQWDCGARQNPAFPKQQVVPGTRIPTLDQVFALAPKGKFLFNIETKSFVDRPELTPPPEEFARMVLAAIRKHHLEARVVLQSFDFRTLIAMKKLAQEIKLSALYEGPPKDFVAIGKEAGATIVSPLASLVTPQQVSAAHAAGLQVLPWTVNSPPEWERLANAGVDGIITDDPAALIAWLKAKQKALAAPAR
jgi:glycerophosphoryl diester phosphodiesterase